MITAPCTRRLVRLPAVRKLAFWVWKMTAIRTRPTTTGRMPLSPARIRASQARAYSLREPATIAGETARVAWLAAASVRVSPLPAGGCAATVPGGGPSGADPPEAGAVFSTWGMGQPSDPPAAALDAAWTARLDAPVVISS